MAKYYFRSLDEGVYDRIYDTTYRAKDGRKHYGVTIKRLRIGKKYHAFIGEIRVGLFGRRYLTLYEAANAIQHVMDNQGSFVICRNS